jgi:hypothetical protein
MVAIEATAGFEAVVAAGLVGAGLPDDLQSEKGYKPFVSYSQPNLANLLYGGVVSALAGVSPVSPPTQVMYAVLNYVTGRFGANTSAITSDEVAKRFRIAKASLIISTRPALTSASAPFSMSRRLPLAARRTFASIDRTTGSISGRWPLSPTCSAAAIFAAGIREPLTITDLVSSNQNGRQGGSRILFRPLSAARMDFQARARFGHETGNPRKIVRK